jgi:serine/threonine-protein kinase
MSDTRASDTRTGRVLAGRYRLDRLIAGGGMAQVWEATDEVLSRKVAVKVLHPHLAADETFLARFRREAVAAARLIHPSIVAIYDTHTDDTTEAIVMELVRGRTLRQEMDRRDDHTLGSGEAAAIVAQVADALETAHKAGVVHRDVKPGNILLSDDGRVMVTDFGIAKARNPDESDLTLTGTTLGTVKYLAPEQVEGQPVDGRTDVYALGVILYEMVCGRAPFTGENDATVALARLTQKPLRPRQVRASVPRSLEQVIMRAMARHPDDRYASAGDLRAALVVAERGELDDLSVDTPLSRDFTATGLARAPAASGPRHAAERPAGFATTERTWLVPAVLIVVMGVALGVAGVLFSRTDAGRRLLGRPPVSEPAVVADPAADVAISDVVAFDPEGDGRERDDLAARLTDADPASEWQTEGYISRGFGNLKDGVGLVVTLDEARALQSLRMVSPSEGWDAEVYVAEQPADSLGGWGEPVATAEGIAAGEATVELGGRTGRYVLIWITGLADDGDKFRVRIGDVAVAS